ncbi:MAG: Fe-S cluster assembly protein SufD [Pseudomonadota bacterium]
MNIEAARLMTTAETAFVDIFEANEDHLPGDDTVKDARIAAIAALKHAGLPTRKVEAWHYTDLRRLLNTGYKLAEPPEFDDVKADARRLQLEVDTLKLPFANGHFLKEMADELPATVRIDPIAACAFIPAPYEADPSDAIIMLNTALFSDGVCLHVAPDAKLPQPIEIDVAFSGDDKIMAATRHRVEVNAGAEATFVDRCGGPDRVQYLSCSMVELTVAENAKATWIISQEQGDLATRLARLNITLKKNAQLTVVVVNAGGNLVRQEINADIIGEGADLIIRGVNLVGGDSHVDVTTKLLHKVQNTTSTETFRNVTTGRGSGVFQGMIGVAQPAQQTDARMACNTLILSDDSGFSAKPELEIFADDVQCAHGATVTDLDATQLFYLKARGIPEDKARALLVKAFLSEIVEDLDDDALSEVLDHRIERWLEAHD